MAGFSLVTVVVLAITSLSTKSSANSGLAKRQTQANVYAKEKLEIVRSEKEAAQWETYCSSWSAVTQTETMGEFTRTTTVTCGNESGKDNMKVHTEVSWYERGNIKKAIQEITYVRY